jgi:hypothetical protein
MTNYYDAAEHKLPRLHDNSSADTPGLHDHDLKAELVTTVPGKFYVIKVLGPRPCVIKRCWGNVSLYS